MSPAAAASIKARLLTRARAEGEDFVCAVLCPEDGLH
jgi:hypothetical protein